MATEEAPSKGPLAAGSLPREVVLRHLRLNGSYVSDEEWAYISSLLDAARAYIRDEIGVDDDYLDAHADLAVATLVMTADMYDERTRYVEHRYENRTVEAILSHHDFNLVPDEEVAT